MRELSLHILDIIQNSITAEATLIQVIIEENIKDDQLLIKVIDNGSGMNKGQEKDVLDPFITSRTTRDVGLGLPLFKAAAKRCEGDFKLESNLDLGTKVVASFRHSHIDRAPLGDIVGTIITFLVSNPKLDLVYQHKFNEQKFEFDTREVKNNLGPKLEINDPQVLDWIEGYLTDNLEQLRR
ncbi:histidine kinase [Halobacteroides halobius DSM 5150]|uniref:Histidine kinase n=1 Tax=Halobacteroides halobius (strain ATCC 35273 / DSM 5150 / MD-1) TaxID=748449 RepID=L0KA22_HALHC|nr:ATP-binding protein [Halobacteroides halobius]AGB42162.1 histidine kinase [Halobacteroides halobius DSM 5150]